MDIGNRSNQLEFSPVNSHAFFSRDQPCYDQGGRVTTTVAVSLLQNAAGHRLDWCGGSCRELHLLISQTRLAYLLVPTMGVESPPLPLPSPSPPLPSPGLRFCYDRQEQASRLVWAGIVGRLRARWCGQQVALQGTVWDNVGQLAASRLPMYVRDRPTTHHPELPIFRISRSLV